MRRSQPLPFLRIFYQDSDEFRHSFRFKQLLPFQQCQLRTCTFVNRHPALQIFAGFAQDRVRISLQAFNDKAVIVQRNQINESLRTYRRELCGSIDHRTHHNRFETVCVNG